MTFTGIQEVLIEAWRTSQVIRVENYLSASTGRLAHLTVRLGGPTGYRDTVAYQLLKDNQLLTPETLENLKQNKVSIGVYSLVVENILANWRELVKEHSYVPPKEGKLELHSSGAFWTTTTRGEPQVVVLHGYRLAEQIIEPGKVHSHLTSPKEDVRAREIFLQSTALRDYVPRLNLSSGKLSNITVI